MRVWLCPAPLSVCWDGDVVALNWFLLLELLDSLWLTEVGIILMNLTGGLDFLLTYWVVLFGFAYRWYDPSWKLRVIRKLVTFKPWSTVIFKSIFLEFCDDWFGDAVNFTGRLM
jgi:hypothetical protein